MREVVLGLSCCDPQQSLGGVSSHSSGFIVRMTKFDYIAVFAALLLPCGFSLAADVVPVIDEQPSVEDRYIALMRQYERSITELMQRKAEHYALYKAGRLRDESFEQLLEAVAQEDTAQLSAGDLAAASMAAEYLLRKKECIRYARLAIARDPSTEAAYRPLVRSLLNVGRIDEAEAVVESAKQRLPETSGVEALHYFLYIKYQSRSDFPKAILHFRAYLNWLAEGLDENSKVATILARRVQEFQEACSAAGREAEAVAQLQELSEQVETITFTERQRLLDDGEDFNATLTRLTGLHYLQCELSLLIAPAQFENAVGDWCDGTIAAAETQRPPNSRDAIDRAFAYATENSHLLHDWRRFEERALQALHVVNLDDSEKVKAARPPTLKAFLDLTRLENTSRSLIGTKPPTFDEVDWILNDPSSSDSDSENITLLHFFAPSSADGIQGIDRLRSWRRKYGDDITMLCVGPYSGLGRNPLTGRIRRIPGQSREGERADLADVLRRVHVDFSCGLVESDAALLSHFAAGSATQFILIDRDGVVRTIVNGNEPRKLAFLEDEIDQVRAEGIP